MRTWRSLRLKALLIMGAFAAPFLFATPASAERIYLQQKHTKEQVAAACEGVNGISMQGPNGSGYGCYNPDNGILVVCDNGGDCTGFIPDRRAQPRPRNNLTMLGQTAPPLGVDPFSGRPTRPTGRPTVDRAAPPTTRN